MIKTYGSIYLNEKSNYWIITEAKPHICIKLKAVFSQLPKGQGVPFKFPNTPQSCSDLKWFLQRYPLDISKSDFKLLNKGDKAYTTRINEIEAILLPGYFPAGDGSINLKPGLSARKYQLQANEFTKQVKRYLLGDDLGLGKTLSATLLFFHKGALPAVVVCQTHLSYHWQQQIEKFTDFKSHVIKTTKPYDLPLDCQIFIFTYSKLSGWVDIFNTGIFKYVIFDEAQELRRKESDKYKAANTLSLQAEYAIGLTATPLYITVEDVYNVLNVIKQDCLGDWDDFLREWGKIVRDSKALGSYLRDNHLLYRRTRADVGMEMPQVNTIVHTVDYDHKAVDAEMTLLKQLAIKITTPGIDYRESGEAALELDWRMRQITGISKAKYVAEYVRMLLENNEPVVLVGWHRAVYEIWDTELAEFNPAYYTGSETPKGKNNSKEKFVNGETNLLIMSLRSGTGLDGLQYRCSHIVKGELDHSPKVHDQLIGRIDRPGQKNKVTCTYLVSDDGSDPVFIDRLALRASQSHGIMDPMLDMPEQHSDDSRIKQMAQRVLERTAFKH